MHSRAVSIALEQLLALPDPSALKPRLTSFLEALLQEHSTRPGNLACAAVELAAFAVKHESQASDSYACACRHVTRSGFCTHFRAGRSVNHAGVLQVR